MKDERSDDADMAAIETMAVFVTAQEAYPAFEDAFLAAEREVIAGFRIFDLETRLRGERARAQGETWLDLLELTLNRGVDVTLLLSDFDPVVAAKYHRQSWKSASQFAKLAELAEGGRLTFKVLPHPARVGVVPRLLFKGKVEERLAQIEPDVFTPGLQPISPGGLHALQPASHHQKLAVFDRERLYIGGLDLNERRYDTQSHDRAAQQTWQDVQVMVTGPVVAAAQAHLEAFQEVTAGRRPAPPTTPGFLRTLSRKRRMSPFHISPKPIVNELEHVHLDAVAAARSFIYLETQFFRHQPMADALAQAAARNPELRLLLVLPGAPEDVAFEGNRGQDARLGEQLQSDAVATITDAFQERALIASPVQPRRSPEASDRDTLHGSPIIYVHSKVSIFDRHEAIVSSANLNGRSLRWDTEAGVHFKRSEHVLELRKRLLDHWCPGLSTPLDANDASLFEALRKLVHDAHRHPAQSSDTFLVPYALGAARAFGEPVPLVPRELV